MKRFGTVLVGILLVGCHAKGDAGPPTTGDAAPAPEMLDALIIPPTGGSISYAQCPYAPEDVPPQGSLSDASLPEFRTDRDRRSNYLNGEERMDDTVLSEHMAPMQDQILRCIDLAACYTDDEALVGEIAMRLEVLPNGRVHAATVDVTDQLAVDPVVPCTRRALAELRFPRLDGGNTFVSYAMTIE